MYNFHISFIEYRLDDLNRMLRINFFITLFYFSLLLASMFFIQLHPKSVWYYFISGGCATGMLEAIFRKTELKKTIAHHIRMLDHMTNNRGR